MKRLLVLFFGMLAIGSAYAEDCEVTDSLKEKECSKAFYKVKNQKELDDYLLNGKYQDGKLLNLNIDFNVKGREINIASSCDIKLDKRRKIEANLNGICIKARNVELSSNNSLIAEKKAPVIIRAVSNINLNNTEIESDEYVELVSEIFSPFDTYISLKDSTVKAENILLSSKSKLVLDGFIKIKSKNLILNGGECDVSAVGHIKYKGNCLVPLKTKEKINSSINPSINQKIDFSIATPNDVIWKINALVTKKNNVKYEFNMPGQYQIQAAVINSQGKYLIIEKSINVTAKSINRGQVLFFNFSKFLPSKLLAMVDENLVFLRKVGTSGIYILDTKLEKGNTKLITIPFLGYKTKVKIVDLPKITDVNAYLEDYLEKLERSSALYANQTFSSLMSQNIQKIRTSILKMSAKDKELMAMKLQANFYQEINVTNNFFRDISRAVFSDAFAEETLANLDDELTNASNDYLLRDLKRHAVVKRSLFYLFSAIALASLPSPTAVDKVIAAGLFFLAFDELYSFVKDQDTSIKRIYNLFPNFFISSASSAEVHNIYLSGKARKVSAQTDLLNNTNISSVINNSAELNLAVDEFNLNIEPVKNFLADLGVTIPEISTLTFPDGNPTGSLNPQNITDVKIINSDDGNVNIKSVAKFSNKLVVAFDSLTDQKVVVRFTYRNDYFGINIYKDFYLNVVSSLPKPVITPIVKGMDVFFGVTFTNDPPKNLNYSWDFGDEQFSSAPGNTTHKYNLPGIYTVKLTVSLRDDESRNVTVEKKIEIAPIAEIHYTKDKFNVQFDATSHRNQNLEGLTYLWDFGDGKTLESSSPIVQHKYANAKEYSVSLKVISSSGASNIANEVIDIAAIELSYHLNLNPRGTYLYTDNQDLDFGNQDNPPWGIPFPSQYVDLSGIYSNPDLNIRPGDMIYLRVTGDYRYGRNGAETNNMLLGVFTDGTAFYHPGPDSDFVPVRTPNTLKTNTSTDIPQDFEIFADEDTALQIPAGATRIAFAVLASNPGITADTDGDFGVWVKIKIVRSSGEVARLNQNLD